MVLHIWNGEYCPRNQKENGVEGRGKIDTVGVMVGKSGMEGIGITKKPFSSF